MIDVHFYFLFIFFFSLFVVISCSAQYILSLSLFFICCLFCQFERNCIFIIIIFCSLFCLGESKNELYSILYQARECIFLIVVFFPSSSFSGHLFGFFLNVNDFFSSLDVFQWGSVFSYAFLFVLVDAYQCSNEKNENIYYINICKHRSTLCLTRLHPRLTDI